MKKFFLPVVLIAIFGLVFSACKNGAYNANPTSGYNTNTNPMDTKIPSFACGIGGYYFTTGIVKVLDTTVYDTISVGTMRVDTLNVLEIVATPEYPDTASHTFVTLGVNGYHGDGTYNMVAQSSADTLLSYLTYHFGSAYGLSNGVGAIYISASGDRLQGSFFVNSTTGGDVISSGTFDLPNPYPKK